MAPLPIRPSRYFGASLAEARKNLRSRPTAYDPEVADLIIDMVANGASLNEICEDRDAPLPATFLRWCEEETRLGDRYREALELHADVIFDEATSASYDTDSIRGGLRHRALLTRAERMMPEKYGPRSTVRNTKEVEDDAAGIDYTGEVRRRLADMADRMVSKTDGVEQGG